MDWMPDFIWNNWGGWMSFLALEWVEDTGSVLAGYVVFCLILVTTAPVHFPLMLSNKKAGLWVLAALAVLSLVVWYVVTVNVHEVWAGYQIWFTAPSDPGWVPVTPDPNFLPGVNG